MLVFGRVDTVGTVCGTSYDCWQSNILLLKPQFTILVNPWHTCLSARGKDYPMVQNTVYSNRYATRKMPRSQEVEVRHFKQALDS